ncbi:MAG: hypothetical protein HFACDABA_02141 [Anaerolineales bacterium]|nr:hypothetical protein [Anaerolineales bacterium]
MKKRLPAFGAILPVFAVIAFLVYGWTLIVFLWKLPSWILFLTLGEIIVIFAYSMTAALLESLAITGILLLVSIILPAAWMRDVFVARGAFAALTGLGAIMLYMYRYAVIGYDFIAELIPYSLAALGLTVLVTFAAGRARFLIQSAAWFSDLVSIFLFLFVPVSLISFGVVLLRNLF